MGDYLVFSKSLSLKVFTLNQLWVLQAFLTLWVEIHLVSFVEILIILDIEYSSLHLFNCFFFFELSLLQ